MVKDFVHLAAELGSVLHRAVFVAADGVKRTPDTARSDFLADHLAKPRHVPQPGVQPATGKRRTDGVHREVRILFGAQTLPDFF